MAIYNILVKLLDGKTITLQSPNPNIHVETLKSHLYRRTHIPPHHQRLISGTTDFSSQTLISHPSESSFLTVNLLVPLLGGKGGFGQQIRVIGTKRKTTNFDSCRDYLTGRRLKDVNIEKRLKEWHDDADGRMLEKVAQDFCKKKMKDAMKSRESETQKYVEKYREASNKCVGIIEASVRDSIAMHGFGFKRLKVSRADELYKDENVSPTFDVELKPVHCHNAAIAANVDSSTITASANKVSKSDEVASTEMKATVVDVGPESVNHHDNVGETDGNVSTITASIDFDKPLDFGDYGCATEMEAVGMERLKIELQARGLKCGGTLEERATRLFLLKTTPIDKLPKKLLAKK